MDFTRRESLGMWSSGVKIFFIGFVGCIFLTSCTVLSEQQQKIPDTVMFNGEVVYKEFEGGFWVIDGDNGGKYNPLNLSELFKKNDLKVRVKAILHPNAMSMHMYGTLIEIVDIELR